MSRFYGILPQKLQNWSKLHQKNIFPPKFPRFSCKKKNRKFAKKNTMIGTYCLKISISEFFSGEIWGLGWLFRVHKKIKSSV